MTPKEFVTLLLPHAINAEKNTGINHLAILAQAAWESGWGKAVPGDMYFGVKDTDGVNGNEQLLVTHEYSTRQDLKFPVIISVTPIVRNGKRMFKYKIKDYFRKYDSPADCFIDHGNFFIRNKRYAKALLVKSDPYKFFEEIAKAGYATDPNYASNLKKVIEVIKKNI